MKAITRSVLVALIFIAVPVWAQNSTPANRSESRPTDASLHELLEVMDAKRVLAEMRRQLDGMMAGMLQKQLQGQSMSPQQLQKVDALRTKVAALLNEELDWNVMEPMYIKIYGDTFSQSEIDGVTAFYRSPAGHAVTQKLPLVMQNAMTAMQQRMSALIPKIQQMAQETAADIKAQSASGATG
jgi:hypothetical protein